MSDSNKMSQSQNNLPPKNVPRKSLLASYPGSIPPKTFKHMVPYKFSSLQRGPPVQIAFFFLKVAALETVRRFSRARCPFLWKSIQSLQVLCYPPFKWISGWKPLGVLVEGVQKISKPLLILSIATAFSEHFESHKNELPGVDDSQPNSDLSRRPSASDLSSSSESTQADSGEWVVQVIEELEKKGITIPERINEGELQRFYDAANGDLSCLLASLKKTIRWRETYHILSLQELEMWEHLVFWHGFDVMHRPCLVIRLGLACSILAPCERPRFAQAVVSQIEHGVLHLTNEEDPRITVLMDCEGISPFRFPMQIMRSCSTLVQDHYPNRLGFFVIIRLPPVVRVLAQTFIQVLKPATRQKLRIEGESYQKVLSELLLSVPAFLGGKCACSKCQNLLSGWSRSQMAQARSQPRANSFEADDHPIWELGFSDGCNHVLRAAIVALLMLCILVAILAGMYEPESLPLP